MEHEKQTINVLTVWELFRSPEHTLAWEYLSGFCYPWEALDGLGTAPANPGYDSARPDVSA